MDNKIFSLIAFALFINLILLISIFYLFKKKNEDYYKKIKKHFLSLLALNISHLHDAANFFAILKNNLSNTESQDLYNFSKGAQFHFRSLFEDLKLSLEDLELSSIKNPNGKLSIYQFAAIDLKDLLGLELIQISNFSRLDIKDNSHSEHALINGNFTLLSKAVLNLVENALKYTDGTIKLELLDQGSRWEIKLSSLGKGIPNEIARDLNSKEINSGNLGHGLSGLSEIIEFHNAELKVETLAGEGACIRLFFDKYKSTSTINLAKPKKTKAIKASSSFFLWAGLILSIIIIVSTSTFITNHNKRVCIAYYENKTQGINNINSDPLLIAKKTVCKETLVQLKNLIEGFKLDQGDKLSDSKTKILEIKTKFLENFHGQENYLSSFIVYSFLNKYSYSRFEKLMEQEAMNLLPLFPDSKELNYVAAEHFMKGGNYPKSYYHRSKVIKAYVEEQLYTSPELYFMKRVLNTSSDIENISNILALFYEGDPLLQLQMNANGNFMDDTELLNGDMLGNTENPEQHSSNLKQINNAEALIEAQNKKIGLNLAL